MFSPSDFNLAKNMGVLSFIGFHASQEVRFFDPSKNHLSLKEDRKFIRIPGRVVAKL